MIGRDGNEFGDSQHLVGVSGVFGERWGDLRELSQEVPWKGKSAMLTSLILPDVD